MNLAQRLAQRSIRVAVSECLLGARVRWDGDHNGDVWPGERLQAVFELVLFGDAAAPRAVAVHDPRLDYTDRLASWHRTATPTLTGVSGYVFADRSPSCGLKGVKVFAADGSWQRAGTGVHAAAVAAAWPELPLVDAEDLWAPDAMEGFAVAVVRHALREEAPDGKAVRRALATRW